MIKHIAQCDFCKKTLEVVVLEIDFKITKIELCNFEQSLYTTERTKHMCFNCYDEYKNLIINKNE